MRRILLHGNLLLIDGNAWMDINMYTVRLYYDGGWLRTTGGYETEEEAREEANADIESYINDWETDGCEYERGLFEMIIEEV